GAGDARQKGEEDEERNGLTHRTPLESASFDRATIAGRNSAQGFGPPLAPFVVGRVEPAAAREALSLALMRPECMRRIGGGLRGRLAVVAILLGLTGCSMGQPPQPRGAGKVTEYHYDLFADHHQFSLEDEGAKGDLSMSWTPEAVAKLLALAP